jgi:hypothetical protein
VLLLSLETNAEILPSNTPRRFLRNSFYINCSLSPLYVIESYEVETVSLNNLCLLYLMVRTPNMFLSLVRRADGIKQSYRSLSHKEYVDILMI